MHSQTRNSSRGTLNAFIGWGCHSKNCSGNERKPFFSSSVPSNKIKFGLRIIYIDTYILPTCLLKVIFGWPSKTYGIGFDSANVTNWLVANVITSITIYHLGKTLEWHFGFFFFFKKRGKGWKILLNLRASKIEWQPYTTVVTLWLSRVIDL